LSAQNVAAILLSAAICQIAKRIDALSATLAIRISALARGVN